MPSRNNNKNKKRNANSKSELLKVVQPKSVQIIKRKKNNSSKKTNLGMVLSPCAWKYARSVLDPFGAPPGACIPSVPAMPSKKLQVFARSVFQTNATGYGFVVCNPFSGVSKTPAWIIGTQSGHAHATVKTTVAAGLFAGVSNSPYDSTLFTTGRAKLVGCGIRVRYVGPLLNRGGISYSYQQPSHLTTNNYTQVTIAASSKTLMRAVDGEWVTAIYRPVGPTDFDEYTPQSDATTLDATGGGVGFLCITVDGAPSATFQYEVFGHYEVISGSIPDVTPGDSDTPGLSSVSNLLTKLSSDGWVGANIDTGRIWNLINHYGVMALSHFGTAVGTAVANRALNSQSLLVPSNGRGPIVEEL